MISALRLANGLLNGTTDCQERRPQDGQTLMPFSRLPNMEIRMNHASTINLWMKVTVKRTIPMNRSFNLRLKKKLFKRSLSNTDILFPMIMKLKVYSLGRIRFQLSMLAQRQASTLFKYGDYGDLLVTPTCPKCQIIYLRQTAHYLS